VPRENPHRPFSPNSAQMELIPEVSGNKINGLGETELRNPTVVYWAKNPEEIPHGKMQSWFYTVDPGLPEFAAERNKRQAILDQNLPPVAVDNAYYPEAQWRKKLEKFVKSNDCEKLGVTELDPSWLFEGERTDFRHVIIAAVHHDYERISEAPKPIAGAEVMVQYTRAASVAKKIASWLHQEGWEAEPVTGPMASRLAMIPAAIQAGFGELGKHGSLINPEFGSSFRLSAVLTNAPLPLDKPKTHGVDDFCSSCKICEDACPPFAITADKQLVRGVEKWYVDFDKCLPFFNEHQGCAICIAECPWSRPGVGLNLAKKLARKSLRTNDQ
jgi:epoxyqueuosine reductase